MGEQSIKISFNSPVILSFTMLCVGAFVISVITRGVSNSFGFSVYRSSIANPMTYFRMIFHVAGHSDFSHLFGNITYILLLGPLLEEKYGAVGILGIIVLTALVTGILHMIFFPSTMLLGASGIVFAFIMLSSITSMKNGTIPLTFILIAVIYIGKEVYSGIFIKDNVSNFTHIIGGLVGAGCGYFLNLKN